MRWCDARGLRRVRHAAAPHAVMQRHTPCGHCGARARPPVPPVTTFIHSPKSGLLINSATRRQCFALVARCSLAAERARLRGECAHRSPSARPPAGPSPLRHYEIPKRPFGQHGGGALGASARTHLRACAAPSRTTDEGDAEALDPVWLSAPPPSLTRLLPTTSPSQSQGIKKLLDAEKQAAEIIKKAREGKPRAALRAHAPSPLPGAPRHDALGNLHNARPSSLLPPRRVGQSAPCPPLVSPPASTGSDPCSCPGGGVWRAQRRRCV